MKEQVVWGIHAGRTGDADSLFLKNSVVAIGWHEMGDLSKIACNRETYKTRVTNMFPNAKPGAIPGMAGQLFRFVCEMKLGDLVLYPSKFDREVHFGQIEGEYFYDPQGSPSYPNRRIVKWLKSVPRTQFTQGALYELGAAMSLFQVKNYPEEYRAILSGSAVAEPVDEDETVAVIAEEIEESTRDFILKTLAQEVKGHPFSHFVANLLRTMGYRTRVSPEGPDGGIDIVAHKDELGFEPPIIKVQAKSGDKGNVGEPVVSALYGKVAQSEFGMVVTLGGFTTQAINFAKGKSNLRLINGNELVDLILSRYELLDSGYNGMLPLRRVYVPEPLGSKQQAGILL